MTAARPPAQTRVEHATADVNGISVHHVTAGTGPPLLLLHGWPETWFAWRHVIDRLAERFTLVAPDLRGTGDTDKPADGYDLPTLAADLAGLLDHLGLDRVGVVGHDVGASSAYALASEHPERVTGLAILDVPLPGFGLAEFDTALGLWHHGFVATGQLAEQMVTGHEQQFVSLFYAQTPYPQLFGPDAVAEYLRCYTAPGALAASLRLMQHLFTDDQAQIARYATHRLPMPVLALGGEHAGRTWPLRSYAEVATTVTGGIIPGAGHWIPEEAPDALAEYLATFFGPLARPPAVDTPTAEAPENDR